MNNSRGGPPPKKETVYEGPVPSAYAGRSQAPQGPAAATATVYNGPAPRETVFDQAKFAPRKTDRSLAVAATTNKVRWFALRFFAVAAVSFYEGYIFREDDATLATASLLVGALFLGIGFFAMRLSRIALLVAMAIYGLDTLGLFLCAISTDGGIFFAISTLFVHAVILQQLYLNYGLLVDLHTD
jgi:hypothetical protein